MPFLKTCSGCQASLNWFFLSDGVLLEEDKPRGSALHFFK